MRQISFVISDTSVTAHAAGKSYTIFSDHPNWEGIKEAIKQDDVEKLSQLADIPKSVQNYTGGHTEVRDGVVYYNGEAIHNTLTERILQLMREGFPFEPMMKFLDNLMENTSSRAVDELYDFLVHQGLPITDDGCFLAYKRVRDNWTDIYTGQIDNRIGKSVAMPRNRVDDNRQEGCSRGLHVGCINYVRGYNGTGCDNGGHVIIVKVNPKDVVSVPADCNCEKLRACHYDVVAEYQGDLTASPLYSSQGQPVRPAENHWRAAYDDPTSYDDYDDDDDDGDDCDGSGYDDPGSDSYDDTFED